MMIIFGETNMDKIFYPAMCNGSIVNKTNNSITIKAGPKTSLTIQCDDPNQFQAFFNFNPEDSIYYSYMISKHPFNIHIDPDIIKNIAKDIMDVIYRRITHGDDQHRAWLRQECSNLQIDVEHVLTNNND